MNVVIDLETLGLSPSSVILSIGAVKENGDTFYTELDWRDQQECGRAVDVSTCLWWGGQDKKLCPLDGTQTLYYALEGLQDFLECEKKEDLYIWARGTDFDIALLNHAFRQEMLEIPWIYKNVRDIRTALAIKECMREDYNPILKHHALSDAIADMKNLALRGLTTYDLRTAQSQEP